MPTTTGYHHLLSEGGASPPPLPMADSDYHQENEVIAQNKNLLLGDGVVPACVEEMSSASSSAGQILHPVAINNNKGGASFDISTAPTLLTETLTASSASFDFTATTSTDGYGDVNADDGDDDDIVVPTQQSYGRKKPRFLRVGKLLRNKSYAAAQDKSKSRLLPNTEGAGVTYTGETGTDGSDWGNESSVPVSVPRNKLPPTFRPPPPPDCASVGIATTSGDTTRKGGTEVDAAAAAMPPSAVCSTDAIDSSVKEVEGRGSNNTSVCSTANKTGDDASLRSAANGVVDDELVPTVPHTFTKDEIQKQNSEKRRIFKAATKNQPSSACTDSGPSLWCTNIQVIDNDVNDASIDVHDDMSVIDVESEVVPFEPFVSRPWEEKKRKKRVAKEEGAKVYMYSEYTSDGKAEKTQAAAADAVSISTTGRGKSTIALLGHVLPVDAQDEVSLSVLQSSQSLDVESVERPKLSRSCNTVTSTEPNAERKAAMMMSPPKPMKRNKDTRPTPERSVLPRVVVTASRPTPEKPNVSRPPRPTPEKVITPVRRTSGRSTSVAAVTRPNSANRPTSPPLIVGARGKKSASMTSVGPSNSSKSLSSTPPFPISNRGRNPTEDTSIRIDMDGMVKARDIAPQRTLHCSGSVVSELTHDEDASISNASVSTNRLIMKQASRKESSKGRLEKKAATHIQKTFRGYSAYRKFLVAMGEIITVQCIMRRYLAVREISRRKLELVSAVKIQSQRRAFVALEGYHGIMDSVLTIQCLVRRTASKKLYNEKVHAAIIVQKIARGKMARRQYREAQCRDAVQRYLVTIRAAVKIQAFSRMLAARKRYCAVRTAFAIIATIQAASKIQAFGRMIAARKRYLVAIRAAVKIQTFSRMVAARRRYCAVRTGLAIIVTIRAALKIQALGRMIAARKRYRAIQQAAVTVQALSRMSATKTRYVLTVSSIVRIQSWARRVGSESVYQTMRQSATVIQCLTRRAHARRQLRATIIAVKRLQTAGRMFSAHSSYQRQRSSAIILQSSVRRSMAMSDYRASLRAVALLRGVAAVTIQKQWRGHAARNHYTAARDEAREAAVLASRRNRCAVNEDSMPLSSKERAGVSTRGHHTGGWQMMDDSPGEEGSECHTEKENIAAVENVADYSFDDYRIDEIECVIRENEEGTNIIASAGSANEVAFSTATDCLNSTGLPQSPCNEAYEVIFDECRKKCIVATPIIRNA